MLFRSSFILILSCLTIISCKKQKPKPEQTEQDVATYFSIRQFASDQFKSFWGQPFSLERIKVQNDHVDSSIVAVTNLDWKEILEPFFKADISDPKFLGQYSFSMLDDDASDSRTYFYEAKNKDLFTRNFQVVTDPLTDKIKSIFIETADKNGKTQKLFYKPIKLIQIQEFESPIVGADKKVRLEYRFLY